MRADQLYKKALARLAQDRWGDAEGLLEAAYYIRKPFIAVRVRTPNVYVLASLHAVGGQVAAGHAPATRVHVPERRPLAGGAGNVRRSHAAA